MLFSALKAAGCDLDATVSRASQIVVFGSWSSNVQTASSDVDVLCIGSGSRFKSATLDVIWHTEEMLNDRTWLGSELATHIAEFGVWLHGSDRWRSNARCSDLAADTKRLTIELRAAALQKRWDTLRSDFRHHHATVIRQDVQRLLLLQQKRPVPPTRLLDNDWENSQRGTAELLRLIRLSSARLCGGEALIHRIAAYLDQGGSRDRAL